MSLPVPCGFTCARLPIRRRPLVHRTLPRWAASANSNSATNVAAGAGSGYSWRRRSWRRTRPNRSRGCRPHRTVDSVGRDRGGTAGIPADLGIWHDADELIGHRRRREWRGRARFGAVGAAAARWRAGRGAAARAQFFTPGTPTKDHRELHRRGGRGAEEFYRERWRHDKEVRSTHGVNCTGSCSWKVYVKDGIITWETQQTDYPSVGPGLAGVRAARLPARRVVLLVHLLPVAGALPVRARSAAADVARGAGAAGRSGAAWAEITGDPERTARYKGARGKGGFVRATWDEVSELIAAAHVHTIKEYGPDRVVGFSPIPAMSQVSYSAGHPVPVDDRRDDPVVLRLVRRHADRLAAGVRRPDRRARSPATGGTPPT